MLPNVKCLVGLFLFEVFLHEGAALFFILGEKETRCFYEDYRDDVMLKFEFNSTTNRPSAPIGLAISVVGPKKQVMLHKEYGSRSTIKFRTSEPGEHGFCVGTNSTKWPLYATETVMVHFRIGAEMITEEDHEEPDEDQRKPPPRKRDSSRPDDDDDPDQEDDNQDAHVVKDPLYGLAMRIDHVRDALRWIEDMQKLQREVEEKFRGIAETTNSRVIMWAILQFLILLLTGWWQMRSLKVFFIAKKLV